MCAAAIANQQQQEEETDHNMWAELMKLQGGSAPRGGSAPLMQRVVLTALGFLLPETECDRNLGAEKRSSVGRGRLHATTRRDALKVMSDGVPMEELQASSVAGAKAPDF